MAAAGQTELRDTVMALRLREASLLSDTNALKCRLIEIETQVCVSELHGVWADGRGPRGFSLNPAG